MLRKDGKRILRAGRRPLALALSLLMTLSLLASSLLQPSAYAAVDENGREVYCGLVAHKHSDACYTTVRTLICGQEETGHHHTEACYAMQERLACGQTEQQAHQHTDECFTDRQVLTCTVTDPEHVHGAECYRSERVCVCGLVEGPGHTHTAECRVTERVLICGREEQEGHIHSDACWKEERVFSCTLSEHEHSLECYSDRSAVESEADWRASVSSAVITGRWDKDLVSVAKSQVGYAPNTRNYVVWNGVPHYYTRYGDWIDSSEYVIYGDWCASFACFCIHYANITDVPLSSNCASWVRKLIDAGMYYDYGEIEPRPGDVMFIYSGLEADKLKHNAFHVGIVVETKEDGVVTIEGNVGPVMYREYEYAKTNQIMGFARLPDNPYFVSIPADKGRITFSGTLPKNAEFKIRPLSAEELEGYGLPEGRVLFAFETKVYIDGVETRTRTNVNIEVEAPGLQQEGVKVYHVRLNNRGRVVERWPVENLRVEEDMIAYTEFSLSRCVAIVPYS